MGIEDIDNSADIGLDIKPDIPNEPSIDERFSVADKTIDNKTNESIKFADSFPSNYNEMMNSPDFENSGMVQTQDGETIKYKNGKAENPQQYKKLVQQRIETFNNQLEAHYIKHIDINFNKESFNNWNILEAWDFIDNAEKAGVNMNEEISQLIEIEQKAEIYSAREQLEKFVSGKLNTLDKNDVNELINTINQGNSLNANFKETIGLSGDELLKNIKIGNSIDFINSEGLRVNVVMDIFNEISEISQ